MEQPINIQRQLDSMVEGGENQTDVTSNFL